MAIYTRVIDAGSFRGAAKEVGLAPSRISEMISELEEYLGVTLLHRTTRKITMTNEGRIFYARIVEMLDSAETGLNELNAVSSEPVGALRISFPAFMASGPLTSAIVSFARLYPRVTFSVVYTDHRMNLIEDSVDMSIRVGWLDENSMMCRKLGVGHRLLVAGAEYAKGKEVPTRPSDLEDWDWIRFLQRPDKTEFTLNEKQTESVAGKVQIEVDNIEAAYYMATQNAGVTVLPSFLAQLGISSGTLVPLIPEWKLETMGIYAVWPDTSRRKSLTQMFVHYLSEQKLC